MKIRKKYLIIGGVILLVGLLAGLGVTVASGPHSTWGCGFHSRFHSEDIADFISWKMDKRVEELNLNEGQMQEYEKIKGEVMVNITEAVEEKKEIHRIIHEEMSKDKPDMNAIANLVKERIKNMPDLIGKNLDLFLKFYGTLDEDQKARLIEKFRLRMGLAHESGTSLTM
jgi:hypothetical protein